MARCRCVRRSHASNSKNVSLTGFAFCDNAGVSRTVLASIRSEKSTWSRSRHCIISHIDLVSYFSPEQLDPVEHEGANLDANPESDACEAERVRAVTHEFGQLSRSTRSLLVGWHTQGMGTNRYGPPTRARLSSSRDSPMASRVRSVCSPVFP